MVRFSSFAIIVATILCFSQTAFSQENLVAWRGTHKFKDGTKREYDYIFDKRTGIVIQQSMESGKVTGYACGEYAIQDSVLTILWTESNQVESGRLESVDDKIRYRITSHNGDVSQIGTECIFAPYQLNPVQTQQIGQLSRLNRLLVEQRKALNAMSDQKLLQLQHDMNMLPYKYSNAFGKALGQAVIE